MGLSRKEKLAEEYAKDWEIRKAFLAGYAACEQDAKKEVFDDIRSQLPGFHACPEWDEMYIWKRLPEMSACSCWTDKIPHASVREFAEKLPTVEARNKENI